MIAILSPALNMQRPEISWSFPLDIPHFLHRAETLVDLLKQYSPWELETILHTTPEIALRAHTYCQDFSRSAPTWPALHSFRGLAYTYLGAADFAAEDMAFARDHVGILSALYGLLRPTDAIRPYRLDMISRLKIDGKGLYPFWGDSVYRHLITKGEPIINLCSQEYAKMILPHAHLGDHIITCQFLVRRKNILKCIATEAKMARGSMVRFLVKNRVDTPELLQEFQWNGYHFAPEQSTQSLFTFIQE